MYGQTEIISAFSHRLSGFEKPCTIGNVLANGEFRIVCPETLEDVTQPGQRGELWVRLLSRFVGYYKDEKAFKVRFRIDDEDIRDPGYPMRRHNHSVVLPYFRKRSQTMDGTELEMSERLTSMALSL